MKDSYSKEEVKKDWEIVSFYDGCVNGKIDGRCLVGKTNSWTDEKIFSLGFTIHSVKRLSDNEVFSIGDEVCYYESKEPIKRFYINEYDGQMWVECYTDKLVGVVFNCPISTVKKTFQPMKDRKEEILEKRIVLFPGTPDMPSDRIKHNVLLSMEQYAKECAIGFSEWLGENGYVKMWLGEKYVGWADGLLMKQNKCVPIEQLYQQYLESIK